VASVGYPELTGLAVDRFVVAPPGLPAAIAEALSSAFMKAMADPALIDAANKAGEPFSGLPPKEAKASADRSIALYLKYKDALAKKD
jgi:tripartite-type tricarboxylate transporter receptor subunit TctC